MSGLLKQIKKFTKKNFRDLDFIQENVIEIDEEGYNRKTGHGLFKLPDVYELEDRLKDPEPDPEPKPEPNPGSSKKLRRTSEEEIGISELTKDAKLVNSELNMIRDLKAGERYKTYDYDQGYYNLGGDQWVKETAVTFSPNKDKATLTPIPDHDSSGIVEVTGNTDLVDRNFNVLRKLSKGERYRSYEKDSGYYNLGGDQWVKETAVTFSPDKGEVTLTPIPDHDVSGVVEVIKDTDLVDKNLNVIRKLSKGERYRSYEEDSSYYNLGGDQWVFSSDVKFSET